MKKIVLKYAAIASLIELLIMSGSVLVYTIGKNQAGSMLVGFTGMIIAFCFTFVALWKYRETVGRGSLKFVTGLNIALQITLIVSVMYVAVWALEYHFVFPDFMDKYSAGAIADLNASGLSPAEISAKTAEIVEMKENYKNPVYFFLYTISEILIVGIPMALIAALVMQRKARPDAGAAELGHS